MLSLNVNMPNSLIKLQGLRISWCKNKAQIKKAKKQSSAIYCLRPCYSKYVEPATSASPGAC